jgi:hyperosmotically inducible protein
MRRALRTPGSADADQASIPSNQATKGNTMKTTHAIAAAFIAVSGLTLGGCAVTRDQSTVGQYIDDSAITTEVKARFANSPDVAATAISVKTLNGVVQLSGFAKSTNEKNQASAIASRVDGVKRVDNGIIVSP